MGTSKKDVSVIGLPLSRLSSSANSSALSSMMSPTFHRMRARSAGGRSRQDPRSKLARAALTARSTSSRSPSATSASTSPLEGSSVGKVLPEAASTQRPPMNSSFGLLLRKGATAMGASYAPTRYEFERLEVLHDCLLSGASDHDHRLLVGVGVGLDVMDKGWHVNVIAGFRVQPDLVPVLRVDELGAARDDVDARLALAVVMRSRSNARRNARFAHPDGSAAKRVAGQGSRARHSRRLRRRGRARLGGHVMELAGRTSRHTGEW